MDVFFDLIGAFLAGIVASFIYAVVSLLND